LKNLVGRLLTIAGAALVIYCLFIPVVIMEFEITPLELGKLTLNQSMQVEASLYNIADRLAAPEGTTSQIPKAINYLWIVFLGLSIINILLALKPKFPKLLRMIVGLLPVTLLTIVIYQTGSNQDLDVGFSGLFEFFTNGFYLLAAGTIIIFIGTLMTGKARRSS
jgi:hypothetical protein